MVFFPCPNAAFDFDDRRSRLSLDSAPIMHLSRSESLIAEAHPIEPLQKSESIMCRLYLVLSLVFLGCLSLGTDVHAKGGKGGGSKGGGKGQVQKPRTGKPHGGNSQLSRSPRKDPTGEKVHGDNTGNSGVSRGDRRFPTQWPEVGVTRPICRQ